MTTVTTHPFVGVWEADRHSSVVFGIRHMQISIFRGSFADLEGRLTVDEQGAHLEGSVTVESISIGEPPELREHVVHGADFLDAGRHPAIGFVSGQVELNEDGTVSVEGTLTIKGVDRKVVAAGSYELPIQDPFGNERIALELNTRIDRRDWGLTWQAPLPSGDDALGWEIDVAIQLELVRQA